MGADMIGYMLRGPRNFPPEALEAGKAHLQGVLRKVDRVLEIDRDLNGPDLDDTKITALEGERSRLVEEIPFGNDDLLFDTLEGASEDKVVERYFEDFLAGWNGDSRLSVYRDFDDGKRVVFVGDISWGDAPDSDEYRAFELFLLTDTLQVIGAE